jgi:uncharacterized protein (TIGR02588 family)
MTAEKSRAPSRYRPGHPHTPAFEWAAAIVSAVLVLSLLGYMIREALTREARPPLIAVHADSVVATESGYLVMFTARNAGGETAAALVVRGTLAAGDSTLEESEAAIDYLPLGGSRHGGLLFTRDPRRHSLELRASGFDTP